MRMDYKGYDEEEELENPWNTEGTRRIKRIFKAIFYSISFVVYAVLFFIFFTSCEPGMFDKMFFTEKTREFARQNPEAIQIYKIRPKDFMNYDGSIELAHIYYAKNTEELEVGVKYNLKKLTDGKVEGALVYILEDSDGNFYTTVSEVYDSNRRYGYARVTFSSVNIDLTQNSYYKYNEISDYDSFRRVQSSLTASGGDENDGGSSYYLYIFKYDSFIKRDYVNIDKNGRLQIDYAALKAESEENEYAVLSKHEIYNNNTVIYLEDYQYDD